MFKVKKFNANVKYTTKKQCPLNDTFLRVSMTKILEKYERKIIMKILILVYSCNVSSK
jgi:hypothetical protein